MNIPTAELAAGIAGGERPALARALSLTERDPARATELASHLSQLLGRARVVGVTGPPGAGKSTLVGSMARRFLEIGKSVAVLAVDPSSPLSGGALLGDRFRMGDSANDKRCYIRSTATRGALGGLTSAAAQMVDLMDAAGFDIVLVETVGTGQSDVAVTNVADLTLVLFPPGLGDELQAIKAGILELADLVVITKSDTEGARLARQALHAATPLWRRAPPIHAVSAVTGEGIAALVDAVLAQGNRALASPRGSGQQRLKAPKSLAEAFQSLDARMDAYLPLDARRLLSIELTEAHASDGADVLEVLYEIGAEGDMFQLGAVAGALTVLAAQEGLTCKVQQFDASLGSMLLELERVARPQGPSQRTGS